MNHKVDNTQFIGDKVGRLTITAVDTERTERVYAERMEGHELFGKPKGKPVKWVYMLTECDCGGKRSYRKDEILGANPRHHDCGCSRRKKSKLRAEELKISPPADPLTRGHKSGSYLAVPKQPKRECCEQGKRGRCAGCVK